MAQCRALGLDVRGSKEAWAAFSLNGCYRFILGRIWQPIASPRIALFILHNPSKAAVEDDPTVRKCIGFEGIVLGATADLRTSTSGDTRHLEIRRWLRQRQTVRGDVRSFAVVDDDVVAGFGRRFVRTSFQHGGLTETHARRIAAELSRPHRWRAP